ncbi:hypothetical protein ABPG72_020849 [Tetrahymena utriculariae]
MMKKLKQQQSIWKSAKIFYQSIPKTAAAELKIFQGCQICSKNNQKKNKQTGVQNIQRFFEEFENDLKNIKPRIQIVFKKQSQCVLNINQQYLNKKRLVSNSKSKSKPKLVNQLPSNPKTCQSKPEQKNAKQIAEYLYQKHIQEVKKRLSSQRNYILDINSQDE